VAERAQTVAAKEARAAGINWTFGPMVDIARDARWGRIVEGAGEDPFLGAAMAAAQVRGFQARISARPAMSWPVAKHFAGYGAADGGRDYDPVYLPEGRLRNVYFPPFEAAVKAGVGTFMSAYMDLNDVPAGGNRFLLHDVLRTEWGFKGFVVKRRVRRRQPRHSGLRARRARRGLPRAERGPRHGHGQQHLRAAPPRPRQGRRTGNWQTSTRRCGPFSPSRCVWACSSNRTPTNRNWRR